MSKCSYYFSQFGELVSVKLYADDGVTFYLPFQKHKTNLQAGVDFVFGNDYTPIELLVKMNEDTNLPKVETDVDVAGRKYKVSFEFEFARSEETESELVSGNQDFATQLTRLLTGWYHVVFEFSSGRRAIARATADTWLFSYEETDEKTMGNITIENMCGIQPIVKQS